MLSSMLSTLSTTSAMSTLNVLSVTSSATSMFATLGVSDISVITVVCLIGLLAACEILSSSKFWNKRLSAMLYLAIIPMVSTFVLIVGYKVLDVISH